MKKEHLNVDYDNKVLEVKKLKKYFYVGSGKNKLTVPAVDGVTFDIYKREVFGLVGESGCGKTTTGRTIIKLYKPTDGSVDLNGERITAGYLSNKINISNIKKETKEKILFYKPQKYQQHQIEIKAQSEIELCNYDIEKIKYELKLEIEKAKSEIEEYNIKLYNLKSLYDLDVENINYNYKLNKKKQYDLIINSAEKEYKLRKEIDLNTYNRKVQGIKESAALDKEVIESRLVDLKNEYEKIVLETKEKYEPLVAEAEANKLTKADIKPELTLLKEKRKELLIQAKHKYLADKADLSIPNSEEIHLNILELKTNGKEKIASINEKITEIKKQAIIDKKAVVKEKVVLSEEEKLEQEKAVLEIKQAAKEKIEHEKATIRYIKESNRDIKSLEASRNMQMIFQDPISSLNPRMTVREIVGEGLIVQGGHSKEEIEEKVVEALTLVGLSPDFVARYPHEFSGGQRQRIGIARALIMNPNFIIADEPISSLDVSIRAQIINLLTELREELGLTILFIAHDLSVVRFFCDRIAVMYYGKIVELAPSEELFAHPMHPYTISLLSAIPQPDPDYEKGRKKIDYNPRMHDYRVDKPTLRDIAPGHQVLANDKEFEEMKIKYEEQSKALNKQAIKKGGKNLWKKF